MKLKLSENLKGVLSSLLVSMPVTALLWFITTIITNLPSDSISIVVALVSFVGISILDYKKPKPFLKAAAFLGLIASMDI